MPRMSGTRTQGKCIRKRESLSTSKAAERWDRSGSNFNLLTTPSAVASMGSDARRSPPGRVDRWDDAGRSGPISP